jgi:hypothetical protein
MNAVCRRLFCNHIADNSMMAINREEEGQEEWELKRPGLSALPLLNNNSAGTNGTNSLISLMH